MTDNEELQGQPGEEIRMPDITYKPGYNKLDSFNWLKDLPGLLRMKMILLKSVLKIHEKDFSEMLTASGLRLVILLLLKLLPDMISEEFQ